MFFLLYTLRCYVKVLDGTIEYSKNYIDAKNNLTLIHIYDCNSIIPAIGHVAFNSTAFQAAHAPSGSNYWFIISFRSHNETNFIYQIAFPLAIGQVQTRYSSSLGQSWSNWVNIA